MRRFVRIGFDVAEHATVEALVHRGRAALPALLAAVERDRRLSRLVRFWRDYDAGREVMPVREVAYRTALMILHSLSAEGEPALRPDQRIELTNADVEILRTRIAEVL